METQIMLSNFLDVIQVLAVLAAGAFFAYKLFSGFLSVDLSTSLSCHRQPANTNEDYLLVTVELSKGERSSLYFHDAQVKVKYQNEETSRPLIGLNRLGYVEAGTKTGKKISWDKNNTSLFRLTSGEKTQFACYFKIPKDEVCEIEAAMLGKRQGSWFVAQWRASTVSLPLTDRQ